MKDKLFNLFQTTGELSLESIIFNILVSAVLGMFIFVSYMITHKGTIYSKKFNASLVVMTVLTGTVMTVIGNNIALSLGMVGALSIVRFRTAIKDSRDTIYIFWTVIAVRTPPVSQGPSYSVSTPPRIFSNVVFPQPLTPLIT